MGKEFKLSEKIVYDSSNWDIPRRIEIQDVKEFIRLLKEEEDSYDLHSAEAIQFRNAIQNKRNKLAGEDLI